MGRQFENVSSRYGAPMGRHSAPSLDLTPRKLRLFRVRLDNGGYDDGGAYWGHGGGGSVWCAMDSDGDIQTCRAVSRKAAALILDIPPQALRIPIPHWENYACALLDGKAPMPQGVDRDDVISWMEAGGCRMGQTT